MSVTSADQATLQRGSRVVRMPATLWIGILLILALEAMLFSDVIASGRGAVQSDQQIVALLRQSPPTLYARLARWVAVNMTPLVWPCYVILLDGVLVMQTGSSPIRRRPHHFVMLSLTSIVIWCGFDAINFYLIHAWSYIGVPPRFIDRFWGYWLAFGAVVPGMLLSGQAIMNARWFDWARGRRWNVPPAALIVIAIVGTVGFVWPFVQRDPITNYTLWLSLILLLDPLNLMLGRPSLLRDWQAGCYGRTLALAAGGLLCGLLWEFWNYWALAKWVYHLGFLGRLEEVRYFQMPVLGLLGFLPFGPQCWVIWQTMQIPLKDLTEPLPDERALL